MSNYIGIPILLLAAVINATIMPELRLGNGAADLVFLMVVSWALLSDVRDGMLWAVIGGAMQDLLSVAPLGVSALGLVIVAFAADAVFGQVSRGNLLVPLAVVAVGTPVYDMITLGLLRMLGLSAVGLGQGLVYVTLPATILNLLLIVPVYRLMGALHGRAFPLRTRIE
ncbi:MAG: rod shape-determining protein MreD [Chloroflexota bacterium]|nr:rod shape-determining protein MreD [Anaerolineae bacterium]HMM28675.1 rod shape-determining protein MreD [Aggregatilineaceae bacterium]